MMTDKNDIQSANGSPAAVVASETSQRLDVNKIRADFPILSRKINGHPLTYFDSAASSQKPKQVIQTLTEYYERHHANVHRGMHTLAAEATDLYEATRRKAARFIGGVDPSTVIFTRNATEAINLVAYTWGEQNISSGDEILISEMEHHANIVPWVRLCEKTGAKLKTISLDEDYGLKLSDIDELITKKTKLVALTRMSNALGTINDLAPIFEKAHSVGAVTLVDAAQSAPHMPTDVNELGCDFLALSGHKALGPTGAGILYGKAELLESMPPFLGGGEMIELVTFDKITYNLVPHKFEAGTPAIADVVGFGAALDYLAELGMENIREHEKEITAYALERLSQFEWLKIYGPADIDKRGAAVSFTVEGAHPHDIAQYLDSYGFAVRAGHHCAQPPMKVLGVTATTRASFYIYNTPAEIDRMCEALIEARAFFKV